MAGIQRHGRMKVPVLVILVACLFFVLTAVPSCLIRATANEQDDAGAKKAFAEAAEVLFHPRCQNCHPAGDAPTVGNDRRPHLFNVKRGPEGKGVTPMNCTLCHRETNPSGGPPGVPNWHMPPENMPMIFQGRTPGELCRQLKDPKMNGGKTGDQIIEHISKDPLVAWAWNPGGERTVPKMSHKEFAAKMNEWVKKGGACPE